MATVFLDSPDVRHRIEEIKKHANKPENFYIPSSSTWLPGAVPDYVLESGTIRVVFSITKVENGEGKDKRERLARHITISNQTKYPAPPIVWSICDMFGFTHRYKPGDIILEPDESWMIGIIETDKCIGVMQLIPDT